MKQCYQLAHNTLCLTPYGPAVVTVVPGLTFKYGSQNKQRIFLDTTLNYFFSGVAYEDEEEKALCADTVRPSVRPSPSVGG
jgi:hypothetical protein